MHVTHCLILTVRPRHYCLPGGQAGWPRHFKYGRLEEEEEEDEEGPRPSKFRARHAPPSSELGGHEESG